MDTVTVAESDFKVDEFYNVGRVDVRSTVDPISLQASSVRKNAFKEALGAAVRQSTRGVFTHDVEATIEWIIPTKYRYQTHRAADLDNVLKPILDAVTGPDQILVDDNQIQSIRIHWMDNGPQREFRLQFQSLHPGDYLEREGLTFVEFSTDRCYMLPKATPEQAELYVSELRYAVKMRQKHLDMGIAEDVAEMTMPLLRPFPRARLRRFMVHHERDFSEPEM